MTTSHNIDLAAPDWSSFLNRSSSLRPEQRREQYIVRLEGKRILITGAGGCIGSALAKSIAKSGAKEIILLDSSEGALYEIHQALADLKNAAPHISALANVSDTVAISSLFDEHRPELVLHAAAFKHVPLMESNPFAAVTNNALGTYVITEAAQKYGGEQMLLVSTDKAVDPHSIMGASKRIAELIVMALQTSSMRVKVVRLGNVLGSTGSVVPLFLRQIADGGPVTVSHPDVRRYFMTLTETVDTLLYALSLDSPGGLLVPQIGDPIRIFDLAKYLIGKTNEVAIAFTQLRTGDKMEESLISPRESYHQIEAGPYLRSVDSPTLSHEELSTTLNALRLAIQHQALPALLRAVQLVVPEYLPSPTLLQHSTTTVNA